jgi:5-methylcytosine-specific restriction endonuclease McrA
MTYREYQNKSEPNTTCKYCGKKIYRRPDTLKKDNNFCSVACRNRHYSGEKSFAWKGGRVKTDLRRKNKIKRDRGKDKLRIVLYKKRAVELLGGKCCICGYDKCIASLQFHHVNPKNKSTDIKSIICCSWSRIMFELEKCVLLCSNCHEEYHYLQRRKKLLPDLTKFLKKLKGIKYGC